MREVIESTGAGNTGSMPKAIYKLYKTLPYILGAYIFLNPFPATSPEEILFYSAALIFVTLVLTVRQQLYFRTPLTVPFILFAGWVCVSLFFALDKTSSLNDAFSHLLKLYLLFYMLINFFDSSERLETLSWLIIISTTIFAVAITLHWYVYLGNSLTSRLGITYQSFGNVTNGYYTVFAFGLALRHLPFEKVTYRKYFLWTSIAILALSSILSQARSTILALVAVVVLLYIRKVKILAVITLLLVAVILGSPLKERFTNWSEYSIRVGLFFYFAEIIKDYPAFGVGYSVDTFRDDAYIDRERYMARIPEQLQKPVHPYLWPHNMFFSVAVRAGLPAVVLFSLFFIVPFVSGWKLARNGSTAEIKSWGLCGLACLGMFFVKGNLDQAFLSAAETIFFTILAIITIAGRMESRAAEIVPIGKPTANAGRKEAP